jgi:copper(I)-binding protein
VTTVKAVKLKLVHSSLADAIEIHSLTKHKGVLQPRVVDSLHLPEHSTVIFGSKGLFLMMTGIKQQLNTGDRVPVSLEVEFPDKKTKTITAVAEVKKMELSYKHYGPNEVYDHR